MVSFKDLLAAPRAEPETGTRDLIKGQFEIKKASDDQMLAFGWASVAERADGEVIDDYDDDVIDPAELEQAAYQFVEFYRDGGEQHERGGVGRLVESIVFTKEKMAALGIPDGALPVGWWIGFRVLDPDVWEKIKDGTYSMFSIEGQAVREEIPELD